MLLQKGRKKTKQGPTPTGYAPACVLATNAFGLVRCVRFIADLVVVGVVVAVHERNK